MTTGFSTGLVAALTCWAAAGVWGVVRRQGREPTLAVLVGAGCLAAVGAAVVADADGAVLVTPLRLGPAPFALAVDPLARWFLGIIGCIGAVAALYSPGYLHHLRKRLALGFVWAALALLLAAMVLVVLAANALTFLVAWEVMGLASFALVAAQHEQHSVRAAALIYLGATRIGTAFLMAGFLWANHLTGSWAFSDWTLRGPSALAPALLIFVGLATKAGCWPFHLWLPIAHPAAPAPVSAVMSAVMIKTAVYGVARLLLPGGLDSGAVGVLILVLGAVSAFWGVLFALLQRDLKRLLAYSSVENVGLILVGLGLCSLGSHLMLPVLQQAGLAAALLHSLNHAVFKSLLFMGAGVVDARTHTRDLEHLGGLLRRMPWTGAGFLTGCAAICALPPLNGFASEWLLYQGAFTLAVSGPNAGYRLGGLLLAGWLAVVGALALACFVRALGIAFLGRPRSRQAERAREGGPGMIAAQAILAAACLGLGLAAPALLDGLQSVMPMPGRSGALEALWSLPLGMLALLLVGTVGLLVGWLALASRRVPVRRYITWECGFGDLGPRAEYTATSFSQPILRLFGAIFRYSLNVELAGRDRRHFPESVAVSLQHEPYLETRIYAPLLRLLQRGGGAFLMRLQSGSIHRYLTYMALALGYLLWQGYR